VAAKSCCCVLDASSFVMAATKNAKFDLMYAIYLYTLTSFTISLTKATQAACQCQQMTEQLFSSFKVLAIIYNCLKPCTPMSQDRLRWQWGGWKFTFESNKPLCCFTEYVLLVWNKAVHLRKFIPDLLRKPIHAMC
jgi:hypothetical protein